MILARIGKTNGEQKTSDCDFRVNKKNAIITKAEFLFLFCDMHKLEILQHIVPL